ncbi:hypothetical protein AT727_08795 [Desulfitobacterium hafniense]|uniref:Uncharacterized protein n=1 Tax=Desulfitobacterium hafniense TaxID=49338 RepID=A0A0W1JG33_DESHA|nr:hypothetical protein [Desulfitobacterium hafniense]KTE90015.1 hypothetical protein AT727_08795 [Desulfitobacterium hafniense]
MLSRLFFWSPRAFKTVTSKEAWDTKTIQKMLKNEKVCEHGIYWGAFIRNTIENILVSEENISICYEVKQVIY